MGHECPSGGEGVRSAGADRQHVVRRLNHVAGAADEQQVVVIKRDHHRFEPTQHPIGSPFLGQFGGGTRNGALVIAQFGFESVPEVRTRRPMRRQSRRALCRRNNLRILWASLFMTTLPSVTWPSPPMAALPLCRRARIVVARIRGMFASGFKSLSFTPDTGFAENRFHGTYDIIVARLVLFD